MAIKVVTGAQGSGKTLYSVVRVANKYFKFDEDNDEYVPLPVELKDGRKVIPTIWSNIEGLKFPHINLEKYLLQNNLTIDQFFHNDYAEKLMKLYGCNIFILDEVQRYFRKGTKCPDKAFWHENHRHNGFDVYYQTQEYDKLSKDIVDPIEFEIRMPRRTFSLHSRLFKYKRISDGVNCGSGRFIAHPRHFALYKSSKTPEVAGGPRPLRNLIIAFALGFALVGWSMYSFMSNFGAQSPAAKKDNVTPTRVSVTSTQQGGTATNGSVAGVRQTGRPLSSAVTVKRVQVETAPIKAGVFFVGDKLAYVQVLGTFYSPSELPYSYSRSGREVTVYVPLTAVKDSVSGSSFAGVSSAPPSSGMLSSMIGDDKTDSLESEAGTVALPNGRYYSRR